MIGYLRLVRLPNVFTVPGDALAGAALAGMAGGPLRGPALAAWAGCCIYLGGMAFNDVFDRDEDARDRPHRPIPSGQATLPGAIALGLLLHGAGLAAAAWAGAAVGACALALILCTFLYNAVLKRRPGPVAAAGMGLCRGLDVLMGALAVGWRPAGEVPPEAAHAAAPLVGAFLVAAYVASLTRAAEGEVAGLAAGAVGRTLLRYATVLAAGAALTARGFLPEAPTAAVPALVLAVLLARAGLAAARTPSPALVGRLVKTSVFGIVLLDSALLLAAGQVGLGAALPLLLVPAALLGRRLPST